MSSRSSPKKQPEQPVEPVDPLTAAARLVGQFVFDKDGQARLPDQPLNIADLVTVVTALRAFLIGRDNDLDTAFGGSTRKRRNTMNKETLDFAIWWLVEHETQAAKKIPKGHKRQDTPRNTGIAAAADLIGLSEGEIKKRLSGER